MRAIHCSITIRAIDMVLLYEHVQYMHDDYETINSRGLEALKEKYFISIQFDCKWTVRTMMEELWKSSYARQVGRHQNENDER